jgi:hypothetical protein
MLNEETLDALHKQGPIFGEHRAARDLAERIYTKFLTEMSWASSKLEGNTYSILIPRFYLSAETRRPVRPR